MYLFIIFYYFLLDVEVNSTSKIEKGDLSRNCSIISTPLTNTENIEDEKNVNDGNISYYILKFINLFLKLGNNNYYCNVSTYIYIKGLIIIIH